MTAKNGGDYILKIRLCMEITDIRHLMIDITKKGILYFLVGLSIDIDDEGESFLWTDSLLRKN